MKNIFFKLCVFLIITLTFIVTPVKATPQDLQSQYYDTFNNQTSSSTIISDNDEKDDTVIDIPQKLEDLKINNIIDSTYIYGSVLSCQLIGQQSESDHMLEILGKTRVNFSDEKSLSFCLQKFKISKDEFESEGETAIDNFIYSEFGKLASKSICPSGYSISSTFKKPLYVELSNGKELNAYYGMYCAYSDNDSSTAAYERLLEDMKQYINTYETWHYSTCYNSECKDYVNQLKIDKYNDDFKQYKELIIANEDENYDFSVGEEYLKKINNMTCAKETESDCSELEESSIYIPDSDSIKNCKSIFGDPKNSNHPAYYMSLAFKIIRYIAIVLLIVLSTMDLISAVASNEDDKLKKAFNKLIKRFIYCIIIFLLPELITFVLKYLNERAVDLCINTKM